MRSGIAALFLGTVSALMAVPASADSWGRYDNRRFDYAIDIPPGFSGVAEAENGDGGMSLSADETAELRIWGAHLVERDFRADIAERIRSDVSEGWAISYDRRTAIKASWSGSKRGRIFYARAMKGCDDAAIHFRLEYEQSQLQSYDAIVGRLVESLHATC